MRRFDVVIVKETHRGLLFEDGRLREVLEPGRHEIPRPGPRRFPFLGPEAPASEVVLIDVRLRDRTVVVPDLLTADGVAITASFALTYRVADPVEAVNRVKSFEDRLYAEVQAVARRLLRAMAVDEVIAARDEVGDEVARAVGVSVGNYGLALAGLDFKDLIVPEEIRARMLRLAVDRDVRRAEVGDDTPFVRAGRDPEGDEEVEADPDADADLIIARASFAATVPDPEGRPAPLRRRQS